METSDVTTTQKPARSRWLYMSAWIIAGMILVLIFFGGMVKSTNSGLSVPDWPNTYGHFMFFFPLDRMVGGIFWEHSHRMIASVLGLATVVLGVAVLIKDRRTWVRWLAFGGIVAVIVQGIMGGVTVLKYLPVWASTVHGTLGQLYFCLMLLLAIALSPSWIRDDRSTAIDTGAPTLRALSTAMICVVILQLVIGAIMRHMEAGLVIPDFPTMFGSWSPPLSDSQLAFANQELARNGILEKLRLPEVTRTHMIIHLTHRLMAFVVLGMGVWMSARILHRFTQVRSLVSGASLILGLLALQITLGILTIYTEKQPTVTTLHVLTGAMVLGTSIYIAAFVRRRTRLPGLYQGGVGRGDEIEREERALYHQSDEQVPA